MKRNIYVISLFMCALLLMLTRGMGAQAANTIYYVTSTGGGDCSDWHRACNLQTAIGLAESSDEIWVAEGTYLPGVDRLNAFILESGVEIYGGFTGSEKYLSERDWVNNETYLSGNIGDELDNSDNSCHVLIGSNADATAVLDGFYIVDGNTTGCTPPFIHDGGAGMYIYSGSPTLRNLVLSENHTTGSGAGLYAYDSNSILENIIFSSNQASVNGGGIYINNGNPILSSVNFNQNSANFGAGIYNDNSDPDLNRARFTGNQATISGGGMFNNASDPTLTNVIFSGNFGGEGGGGMANRASSPTLTNVTLGANHADGIGAGGGLSNEDHSYPILNNCILWGNTSLDPNFALIYNSSSAPEFSYSLVQGSGGSGSSWDSAIGFDKGGNIDTDPLFIRNPNPGDDTWRTLGDNDYGDLHLQSTSPAINSGNNAVVQGLITTDLDGNPRIYYRHVDMGAFEAEVVAGLENDAWQRAQTLTLTPVGDWDTALAQQTIEARGQSRWYKFTIYPGSRVVIRLSELPTNYDLTLYTDIQAAYDALVAPADLDDLAKLTAEFAPDSYAPDSYAPDSYAPDSYAPDAYAPDSYAPDSYAADIWAPDSYAPDSYAPDSYAPDSYAPDSYAPDSYAPDSYAPDSYAPDSYAPDEAYTSAQMSSLIAVSAFDGTAGEFIAVNTWDNAGDFYIRVKGRNGAYAPGNLFTLQVGQQSGACDGLDVLNYQDLAATAGNYQTIILADFNRMGIVEGDDLSNRLDDLALAVNGVVVDVSQDDGVFYGNQQADQNSLVQCPYAKNLVAREIKQIIEAYWELNPLDYVVIIGNDNIIPFFRYPDRALLASEKDYEPPVQDDTTSFASLTLGYVLSQDFYGTKIELSRNNTSLPIPALAVGRLVEDPVDIVAYLDAFLADDDGVITPASALATGYDFLADAATAIALELETGIDNDPNETVVETLIAPRDFSPRDSAVWTATDLGAALLGSSHDLVFLAGHFSANSALAADYDSHLLTTDITAAASGHFQNTVIFSAGCHAGYNIVNPHGIPNLTLEPDWAQAFIQQGANLIAGTGYQYGDTDFIEYNERLYLYFSRQLRAGTGPVSIGKALVDAKNRYLANTPELRGIHEKALLETTLYGLPMFSVNMPYGRDPIPQPPSLGVAPQLVGSKPGSVLGLKFGDVSVITNLTQKYLDLHAIYKNVNKISVTYFVGDNGVVTRPGEPVLPLAIYDASVPNTVLRGIGFRGGSYVDHANTIPLTGAPATEVRGVHPPFWTDVFFPIRTWQANYFDVLSKDTGGLTTLALTPVQFLSDAPDVYSGTLREYFDMDFRLYYSDHLQTYRGGEVVPILSAAPTIAKVTALAGSGNVNFNVYVTGDPNVGIQEAWITYTCEGTGTNPCYSSWMSLDLVQNSIDTRLWETILPLDGVPAEEIRYMVQAVNGTGLVALNTNLGYYFTPNIDPAEPPTIGAETDLSFQLGWNSDYYGSYVPMRAALTSDGQGIAGEIVYFAIGAQKRAARTNENGIAYVLFPLLSPPGDYRVRAAFVGTADFQESSASTLVTIEKQPTMLGISPEMVTVDVTSPISFTINLKDSLGRPMRDKTVFTIISGDFGDAVYKEATNYLGQVVLKIAGLPVGEYSVNTFFSGPVPIPGLANPLNLVDAIYEPSTASASIIVGVHVPLADEPIPVGTMVNAIASLADPDLQATSIVWDWGDGSDNDTVSIAPNLDKIVTAYHAHVYSTTGVHVLTVTLYDDTGSVISWGEYRYLVVYDPAEGFVTGGGWIESPANACLDFCGGVSGKAYFGFVSKYKKGATVPTGETEFEFTTGDLNFFSDDYEWLVIAGSKAMFKGTGTINGSGTYKFMISAIDGKDDDLPDEFRIRIWKEIEGVDYIIYDNQTEMVLGGGSITIHRTK